MNSLSFKQGDIVVATLLFSEQIGAKKRPALVISNSSYNAVSEDLILLKITSNLKKTGYDVILAGKDVLDGKLKAESLIMVDNPVTTYKQLIERKVGRITEQKLNEVKQKIKQFYAL
ncbi:MAG TPA: type II toxin-antitoxin system PemK/MazF family toxin [Candidatus Diapherotrites archaeon]|uniref:Type II toxin-antitoxin system PemK/MazF family toxin n=1 Tax=Candidatus Iainarchaeum sp. TaxID=3101447 RepID=A0A7J4JTP1_9ARCH|nr:type II toxin-antitoxin system PemK/MazF family toxin [Candidatus Diapherotrites archaeon]